MDSRAFKVKTYTKSSLCTDQITFFQHLLIIFRLTVYCGPNRYHELHAHFFQFFYHRIRIRPVDRIKFPLSLLRPVKKVNNDHIKRKAAALIFTCNLEQFFLCLIAKLTLPEPHAIFRHHGNCSSNFRVIFLNFSRCIPHCDPIVQRLCAKGFKTYNIFAQNSPSDSRVIPQKTVPLRGNEEGNACLRISVRQFQIKTFQVKIGLLILSHTE